MNSTTKIVFTDIEFRELGVVEYDGQTLVPSNEYAKSVVDHYMERGMTPEKWVAKFSAWSNGLIFAEAI